MDKKEEIISLLQQGMSYNEIAKKVGCNKSTISFHAQKMKMSRNQTPQYDWQEIQKYHDAGHGMRECQKNFGFANSTWSKAIERGDIKPNDHIIPLEVLLVSDRHKTARYHLKNRLLRVGVLKRECAICGITEWQGKPLAFDLDHINGINNDNRLENLRILCPNCHSQTETHAGKNNLHKKKRLLE